MTKKNKQRSKTSSNTSTSSSENLPPPPKVVLRTYRDTDWQQVDYLFKSTQIPLVYESIRSKLWAFPTWVIWFAVYSSLLILIPRFITTYIAREVPQWAMTVVKIATTFVWAVIAFAILFITSDRVETQNRVDEALANDLKDPLTYYLNYTAVEDKENPGRLKRIPKPENEHVPSHFWVLTLDDELCGMIGLQCNPVDVQDQRATVPVAWKQFIVAVLELFRSPFIPSFLLKEKPNTEPHDKTKRKIFAHKQIPKTATITRWAVRSDLQTCGFSTLLLNRAMMWADEHDINRVYAMTNECCMAAEQILTKRHGFVIMKRYNLNFFGQYQKLFGCRVKEWMEKNAEKTRKVFNKKE
ncbi:hypothetical protein BDF20DRAFT_863045 [Mycotypha africana]|uniref:uncharacterized protein n=1 Tax=Mycotypha africana TaxID=64632 RepID=UPI0022FFFD39|nr:uncharacterized protein BDF20DRAFT_863045 [Mycotypha africana]KAI8981754.1 hypothetical protein BDF20DRAFT_863045 [Mycotypha africana]